MGMSVVCSNTNVIANRVMVAGTFFRRLTGLIPQRSFSDGDGLILKPCKQVHTYFMNFNIDVLFLAENNQIIHMQKAMEPNQVTPFVRKANVVVELSEGTIDKCGLKIGDVVDIYED